MVTQIVNIRNERCDLYIGRSLRSHLHYGNPFTIGTHGTREEVINKFELWLRGVDFKRLEQERRRWILGTLHNLEGKRLGCYCAPNACHGDVYVTLISEMKEVPIPTTGFREFTWLAKEG